MPKRTARLVLGLSAAITAGTRAQGNLQQVRVDDPRPLAEAILRIEHLCRCAVTYEDPRWTADQVRDVTAEVTRDGKTEPKVYSPDGRPFTFAIDPAALTDAASIQRSLGEVIDSFQRSGNPGTFEVRQHAGIFHVQPSGASVLDTRLSIPAMVGSGNELIDTIMREVGARHNVRIVDIMPVGFLRKMIQLPAMEDTAEVILDRIMTATGRAMSWRLFFDYGSQKYALNMRLL